MSGVADIPPWLPATCAFGSACMTGLTSFGDAIVFQTAWAVAIATGLMPGGRDVLATATLHILIMSVATQPAFMYAARKDMKRCLAYGAVMSLSGIAMVPVGSQLLFFGNLTAVYYFAASLFLVFSVGKLTWDAAQTGRRRLEGAASGSPPTGKGVSTSAASAADPLLGGAACHEYDCDAAIEMSAKGGQQHTSVVDGNGEGDRDAEEPLLPLLSPSPSAAQSATSQPSTEQPPATPSSSSSLSSTASGRTLVPACIASLLSRLPPLTIHYTPAKTLLLLLAAGAGSGFLDGLLGTGGPPQIAAFTLMSLDKDSIRAISVIYTLFELPVRLYTQVDGSGGVFDWAQQWRAYLSVGAAAIAGFGVGTFFRRWTDSEVVSRILLSLVFSSSGMMFGLLHRTGVAVAYAVGAAVLLLALALLLRYPHLFLRKRSP